MLVSIICLVAGGVPSGKTILKKLKTTSVMASCARAWTLELLINRHQNQQRPFTTTVLPMMTPDGTVKFTTVWSADISWLIDMMAT